MIDVKGKTFVITGTSSGIGLFLAKELLKKKCNVIGLSRKKTNINNKMFSNLYVDLTSNIEIEKFYKKFKKKFKKIDVLINNAGISVPGNNLKAFEANIKTNLISTFYLNSKLFSHIRSGGKIINISSIASIYGFENNPGYNSSKAALNSLTRSLANDLAKDKIFCNTLSLGYFRTKITEKSFSNSKKNKNRLNQTVLKRWGKMQDILGPVLFLSSSMSNYITGQNINVDGGWSIKGFKF
tara:strand:+ start:355 stop:1074 length:720 start_codon:yes stop_codon:yes gene_type:complete